MPPRLPAPAASLPLLLALAAGGTALAAPAVARAEDAYERALRALTWGASAHDVRCATVALRDVLAAWDSLTEDERRQLRERGVAREPHRDAAAEECTTNFCFQIGSGGWDSGLLATAKAAAEDSWSHELDVLGYDGPPNSDRYYIDVYIANTGGDMPTLGSGTYGYTTFYGSGTPYIVLNDDYSWSGTPDDEAIQVTLAHEFFHAVQGAYDFGEEQWVMEGTAAWMEDEVFPSIDDYVQYVLGGGGGFLDYPELSLRHADGYHEYGAAIFWKWMSEHLGGPGTVRGFWEEAATRSATSALDRTLSGEGTDVASAMVDFSVRNVATDYQDGGLYGTPYYMETVSSYPVSGRSYTEYLPDYLGANYVRFRTGSGSGKLTVEFDGDDSEGGSEVTYRAALVARRSSEDYDVVPLTLDSQNRGSGSVSGLGSTYQNVALVAAVVSDLGSGTGGYSGAGYSFDARLDPDDGGDDDDTSDDDSAPGDDDTGSGDDDTGPGDDDSAGDDKDEEGGGGSGRGTACACSGAGPGDAPGTLAAIPLAGLLLASRRRR
ncbi:DUF6055 domain-containing protein [Myxococcota bacterium]|nr:DUF6055 domain-containing protein [Myxococcota bacterium]